MAENLNPTQNPLPDKSSSANQPSVPQSQGASPLPAKPPEPNLGELFKLFGSRWGFIFGALVLLFLIVVLAIYFKNGQFGGPFGKKATPSPAVYETKVPQLQPVKDESTKKLLEDYFKKASPANFKLQFMNQVPQTAADAYFDFIATQDKEQKLQLASRFYIYLDNPGADRSDPAFGPFLADVKADLEKTIAQPLF